MLTGDRLLPSLDIKKLGFSIYLLEFVGLWIYPLALHLTRHNRALESHDAQIVSVGRLDNDEVSGLYALTGCIPVDALARILETHLEKLLVLLLAHAGKPVVDLEFATSLTVVAVDLSRLAALHCTSSGAVIFLVFFFHSSICS